MKNNEILEMVENNIPLVKSIATHYMNKGIEFDDLVQEGCVGLIEASLRFDDSKNSKFSTYAVWWIKKYIILAIETKNRLIKYPMNIEQEFKKIVRAQKELEVLGVDSSIKELSKKTGLKEKVIEKRLNDLKGVYSLNRKNSNCEDFEMGDSLYNNSYLLEDNYEVNEMNSIIYKIIRDIDFTVDEKKFLIMYYGLDGQDRMSLANIGKIVKDVSRGRMGQISDKILLKFRIHKDIEKLKIYLDKPEKSYSNLINLVNKEEVLERTKRKYSDLYNYFKLFDQRIVNKAMSLLDTYEQDIIYICFDKELNLKDVNNFYINKFIYYILPKLEKYIYLVSMRIDDEIIKSGNCETVKHKKNSYYSYFEGFEKEFIDVALKKINDEQKNFLNIFFEKGLDNSNSRSFTEEEYDYFMNNLIYPIRRTVKIICNDFYVKTSFINIYDMFNQYSKDLFDFVIDNLNYDEKELILNFNKLSKEKRLYVTSELLPKTNNLLKRKFKSLFITGKNKTNLFSIISEYDKSTILNSLEDLSLNDYNLLKIICGEKFNNDLTDINNNDKVLLFENLLPKIYKNLEVEYNLEDENIKKLELKSGRIIY